MKKAQKIINKRFLAILATGLLIGLISPDIYASGGKPKHPEKKHHTINNGHENHGRTVGAPLDGGLITLLLGGAGVAYLVRKRKKDQQ